MRNSIFHPGERVSSERGKLRKKKKRGAVDDVEVIHRKWPAVSALLLRRALAQQKRRDTGGRCRTSARRAIVRRRSCPTI